MHWDVFHANIEDRDFGEAIDRMGIGLCTCIWRTQPLVPGYGHLDFPATFRLLKAADLRITVRLSALIFRRGEAILAEAGRFIGEMKAVIR